MIRLFRYFALIWPFATFAEPVQIPGPEGPLEAEMIVVEDARHVVVIVPGSGPTDRDGNGPQGGIATDTYKLLAEALAEHGIASLRIDKRGLFGSATAIANPNRVTIEAYASDTADWLARAGELAPCTWIAGHSEGGLVALVTAANAPDTLCGLILLATPGRPLGQLMVEQFEANPANKPILPEVRSLVSDLEAGKTPDLAEIPSPLKPLFAEDLQGYMTDLFSYDPADIAGDWGGPALIVQGDADLQVKEIDADRLQTALPNATRLDLPGATHMLKIDVPGDPIATYRDPDLPLHPDLIPGLIQFLNQH